MKPEPTIRFNQTISTLIENMQNAWNRADLERMAELMEEDVVVFVEPVTVGRIHINPKKIEGREQVVNYIGKLLKRLPLRYTAEFDKNVKTKNLKYRKFFYEIKAWAYFDSTVSKYGRFKEFKIGGYENARAEKLTTFYIVKNILSHRITSLFKEKV